MIARLGGLCKLLQNLWNPFRDWNWSWDCDQCQAFNRYKTSETLLGIETKVGAHFAESLVKLQNLWNPFRDWNWYVGKAGNFRSRWKLQNLWNPFRDWNWSKQLNKEVLSAGYKTSETLLGIETQAIALLFGNQNCYKTSETLLGIETFTSDR